MVTFSNKLKKIAEKKQTRIILSLDLTCRNDELLKKSKVLITNTANHICAVKINYHLLLPLSFNTLKNLISIIHKNNLLVIADIKLNDISSTNLVAINYLWKMGFDAIIVNPFVGFKDGLDLLLNSSRNKNKGVIFLVYMSHIGAKDGYGLEIFKNGKKNKLYYEFAKRALSWKADGMVIGGNNNKIITEISKFTKHKIDIFSPGIGYQGGNEIDAIKSGVDYLIIGRTIINSKNPSSILERISLNSWNAYIKQNLS